MTKQNPQLFTQAWWKKWLILVLKSLALIAVAFALDWFRAVIKTNLGRTKGTVVDWFPPEFLSFNSFLWITTVLLIEGFLWWVKCNLKVFKAEITERFEDFSASVNSKNIVFNVNLSESYSKEHINDLHQRLAKAFPLVDWAGHECPCQANCERHPAGGKWLITIPKGGAPGGVANLYAVDSTSPYRWWSESMLGYLAVLAEWKAQDCPPFHQRQLSRLFVWTPADLRSPLGRRLIHLHRLFGFDTYIVLKPDFESIRKRLLIGQEFATLMSKVGMSEHFGLKEFVVWEGCPPDVENSHRGYRSYWSLLEADHPERETYTDFDGATAIKQEIKWRDFPNGEADHYLKFFKLLTKSARAVATVDDFVNCKESWDSAHTDPIYKLNTIDGDQVRSVLNRIAKP
jgi:hypothetical protein